MSIFFRLSEVRLCELSTLIAPDIELFANQAAIAILNMQFYKYSQGRSMALQALHEASRTVTQSLDLQEILDRISEQAWSLMSYQNNSKGYVDIFLVEDCNAHAVAAYPKHELQPVQSTFPNGIGLKTQAENGRIGIIGRGIRTRVSQLVRNVALDPDYLESHPATCSELVVPIIFEDRLIGIINAEYFEPRTFSETEQITLEALAAQAGIAIQNARQYHELSKTKGQVAARTAVAWMGMASANWRHGVSGSATIIEDLVELIRLDLASGASSEQLEKRLHSIAQMSRRIRETPITAPLSIEEGVESVSIHALLRERIQQLHSQRSISWEPYRLVQYRLELTERDNVTIRASSEWIRRAFDLLVDNAVEAMAESMPKELIVGTRIIGDHIEICIRDTGRGIPETVMKQLFQEPVKKTIGAKGLGMGLLLAQTIVQTYGGEIRIDATGVTGTSVVISLPLEM